MKIVLTGGGTGGHITPLLAIAQALKAPNLELHYIGIGSKQETLLLHNSEVIMHEITTGKFRRYHGANVFSVIRDYKTFALNFRDAFRFGLGVIQSLILLLRLKPQAVFVKGGFVGLPVGIAAYILSVPLIIHESDSVLGLTNKILSLLTKHRLSGFELKGFTLVGNPVRREILRPVVNARRKIGVTSKRLLVLIFGGSSGSTAINQVVIKLASQNHQFELIHITGAKFKPNKKFDHYHVFEFLHELMPTALHAADVVVCRSGANTLAELAALSKPSIVIPHPELTGDHQTANASAWEQRGAIVVIPQSQLTAANLQNCISDLISSPERIAKLKMSISKLATPDAATDVAKYILAVSKG